MEKFKLQEMMGINLRKARLNAHMTQEELAEKAGISASNYTNLEHGRKGMSSVTLISLANALNVSVDSILYGSEYDVHIQDVIALLRGQSDDFLVFVFNMIRFMLTERDRQEKAQREEIYS